MKKIIMTVSLAFALLFAHAQEAQITALETAVKSKTKITNALANAEYAIKGKLNQLKPEFLCRYYMARGKAELLQNNFSAAGEVFEKLREMRKNGYFEVKNKSTKQKEYYYSKETLDKAIAGGNYSKSKKKTTTPIDDEIKEILTKKVQTISKEGSEAYNKKDYLTAGNKFFQTYQLQKAQGDANEDYLYYAAVAYQQLKKFDKAAELYDQLIKDGYNGVKITYYATNVANGKRVNFPDKKAWESYKKNAINAKLYKDWGSKTSKDISKDLYTYAATINYNLKRYKRASEIAQQGLNKLGDNTDLQSILSNSIYKSGDSKSYIERLRKMIQAHPNDANSLYNLGVMLSGKDASPADKQEAKEIFKKVLSLNPNNTEAALNMAAILIERDSDIVKGLNKANSTSKEGKAKYDSLFNERRSLHKEILPYLEQVIKAKPNDIDVLKTLKASYSILGMDSKKAEIKQRIKELEGK